MDWTLATNFLIAILAIVDPLGKIPLWIEAAERQDGRVRWRLAVLVTVAGGAILLIFLFFGQGILRIFGISLASFRIGGGVVIMLTAIQMMNGQAIRIEDGSEEVEAKPFAQAKRRFHQVVVPLVFPFIAGPASISTVIIYGAGVKNPLEYGVFALIVIAVMAIVLAILLAAHRIERVVGNISLKLTTRLFGLILAAIAAQLIIEGLGTAFPQWLDATSPLAGLH